MRFDSGMKNNGKNSHLVNRRTLLKGAGVSLALPFMNSLSWANSSTPSKPPVRLGFMYMPHGVIMDQFWPKSSEEYLKSASPAIESLRPVLDQCLMMKGISMSKKFVNNSMFAKMPPIK